MALVIDLKPEERVIIGSAVITNDKQRSRLQIDGNAPILREKDVMHHDQADTPFKAAYFIIQGMYLATPEQAIDLYEGYFDHTNALKENFVPLRDKIQQMNKYVLEGHYYKAMKAAKDLITHEEESSSNAA